MTKTPNPESLAVWQNDAYELAPPWLPRFWQPRVIVKKGRFSPLFFMPSFGVWVSKTGAFNMLNRIAIGEDLLEECPPQYRRAIVAHEMGHLSEAHTVIWMVVGWCLFNSSPVHWLFNTPAVAVAKVAGIWAGLGTALLIGTLILWSLKSLQVTFEHRADDYAASKVGLSDTIEALTWIRERMLPGKKAPWINERIERLKARRALPGNDRAS